MSGKNYRLRKRIVRVFKASKIKKLSTREIKDKLSEQKIIGEIKRYSTQPPITRLSNILNYHPEFERCKENATVESYNNSTFKMAMWELTEEGRSLV